MVRIRWLRMCVILPAVVFLVALVIGGIGHALDFNDVVSLKRNGVNEEVIINLIRQDPAFGITPEQAAQLRMLGASENMVMAIPDASSFVSEPVPVTASPTVVTEMPASPVQSTVIPDGSPIVPVAVTEIDAKPALYAKEGWVSISNTDWESYFLVVDQKSKRMFLSRNPNGGMELPSGRNITINVRKETYKMYGDSGRELKVKVREGETTRISLVPFGAVGNSGLNGVSQDREKVRSETLFHNYVPAPAVIVREAPPVIVVPAPPPPHYYRPYDSWYFGYRRW